MPDLPYRVAFFFTSLELLHANPAMQGEEKADDVSLSLLISQLLGSGRTPRVSSFYKRPWKWSMILTASQVNDFSISLEFLCGIPFAILRGDVEQRFKRFRTIYVVWRGCLSRHGIYNYFYVQFESQVFCLFL